MTSNHRPTGSRDLAAAPKDRPIIFSAPMVRALIAGQKTQTRRILKPQLVCFDHSMWPDSPDPRPIISEDGMHCGVCGAGVELSHTTKSGVRAIPVRFAVGDLLWVRENWYIRCYATDVTEVVYKASTGEGYTACVEQIPSSIATGAGHWALKNGIHPSIHMPRWASRLTLAVTGVKIERLQDISEADARAEGVDAISMADVRRQAAWSARGDFAQLWNNINGKTAWDDNPFVVAVSFDVVKANIDRAPALCSKDGTGGAA